MSPDAPADMDTMELQSMTIPTISVIVEIVANCYIIWFLLIDFPTKCARLALETSGMQTCGMEGGTYVIATISAVLILGGIYYLTKWHFSPKPEN